MALAKFFRFPFGTSGDRAAVPDPVDVSGNVSYEQGYGPDYQRANTDPLSKDIERNKANQLQYDITLALREYQTNGTPDWITAAQNNGVAYPYPAYARVRGPDGIAYTSTTNANTNTPPHATWLADTIATPPQFDADLTIATTAFVQRALGNAQLGIAAPAVGNFFASDCGGVFSLTNTGTYGLPALSTCPPGATFHFQSTVSGSTIARQGADSILLGSGSVTSLTLNNGDTATITKVGGLWVVIGGTAAARGSAGDWGRQLTGNGYQKLPSGLILQWGGGSTVGTNGTAGTAIATPIAFPSVILAVLATDSGATDFVISAQPSGTSAIKAWARDSSSGGTYGNAAFTFLAIGF